MSSITLMWRKSGRAAWAITAWAGITLLLSLLPEGMGGDPRALNALLFLGLGPGCALMLLLRGSLPQSAAVVVALGSSLGILVLSSQLLLLIDLWHPWAVTALVAAVTVVLAFAPWRHAPE